MDDMDGAWVEAVFGVRFTVDSEDLRPAMEAVDAQAPGAFDLAHLLQGADDPLEIANDVAGIDDVMAGRRPRPESTWMLGAGGEYYYWLDYSKLVIGREFFEIRSVSPTGGEHLERSGSIADLRRLCELWRRFVEQQRPIHDAFERGRRR